MKTFFQVLTEVAQTLQAPVPPGQIPPADVRAARQQFVDKSKIENQGEEKLKQLLKQDYTTFVQNLGSFIHDPKFYAALTGGNADGLPQDERVKFTQINVPVAKLVPTQNEIDVDKSLSYPLTKANIADDYLKGGVVAPAGKSIVTGGGGSFIIDGHHRWSQVYCLNPNAQIKAIDLSNISNPADALKITQMAIAVDAKKIPISHVKGYNLLAIQEQDLTNYISNIVGKYQDVQQVFAKYGHNGIQEITNYVVTCVKQMQQNNQPVPGAPPRSVMPQTDDAPNWIKYAQAGILNFKRPLKPNQSG